MHAPAEIKPTRPAMRWYGGKWRLADWIISQMPPHRVYVEPFGGAASVLLQKQRSAAEVYNDLDGEAVNLFRVLQNPIAGERLIELLRLTPFARAEFELSGEPIEDPVERARRLIIRSFMGFGSNAHNARPTGFRSFSRTNASVNSTGFRGTSSRSGRHNSTGFRGRTGARADGYDSRTTPAHDWMNYPEALAEVIERFRGVIIENREAEKVIRQHDSDATLFYVDPPYMAETRSPANKHDQKYRMYRHELTDGGHGALIEQLRGVAGMVLLSGYPSALYDAALSDWRRVETAALADGARKRVEVLWSNPQACAALERVKRGEHSPLFAERV